MSKKNCVIRLERKDEYRKVENLTREAFWNVYKPGCSEHYVLNQLRKDSAFVPELDLCLEKDGELIGHVMYMHASIDKEDGTKIPIMTFGPISIAPDYKRKGYGKMLLDYSLEKAKVLGAGAICMEGNIDFYGKSGFVVASTMGIHYHGEPIENEVPYFLCKELEPDFLKGVTGIYHTPSGYYVDEEEVEEFDKQFPVKEKLTLPGQLF